MHVQQWGLPVQAVLPPVPFGKPRQQKRNKPHAAAAPGYAAQLFDEAAGLHRAGALEQAAALYERVLLLAPYHGGAHANLGVALMALGRVAAAIPHYESAIAVSPGSAALHFNLGNALGSHGRADEAAAQYRRALSLRPDYAEAHNNLGNLLAVRDQSDEALQHYRRAIAIDPGHAGAHNNAGNILREQGKFEEAMAHFDRAIAIRPSLAEAHYHRAEIRTFRAGDPDLAVLEALARTTASPYIHFALAKALEDTGDYARSFEQLKTGNRLKRGQIVYDEKAEDDFLRRIAGVFDRDLLDRLQGQGDPSDSPVFVVGMPRSGSTLIEQILASHPEVHGAGEREDLGIVAGAEFPESSARLDAAALRRMAAAYLSRMSAGNGRLRTIDKLPNNFLRIGLIRLMLPNARIIHTVRNPLDTCVSCYSKLFAAGQHFSYDLAELGRYYGRCRELMAHWDSVLPEDSILHVRYEDVVDDPERQARRMIEYCGLSWDDRCMRFYENKRPVKTASSVQVRKPLFRSSLQRWRRYEAELGPLIQALGEARAMMAHN